MKEKTEGPAYTVIARGFHWITAALILVLIPLGMVIRYELGGPLQDQLYDLHRSIGALLIPVVVTRFFYRLTHRPLPLTGISHYQQLAAEATHWALYALLILQPFIGWIATSAYRAPIIVFGLFELPPIWPERRAFSDQMFLLHSLIGVAITALVTAHIAAALHHHFVRKDRVLMRIITG
jgi:cytochrome b561